MATRELLSPVQRLQFTEIPDSITTRDIARYYTLSNDELKIIKERRRPHNRLGFAVQLCYLRFPGRVWILGEIVPESVPDKKLYTFEPLPPDSVLAPLLGDKINVKLIQGSWDEILRLSDANLSRAYLSRAYLKGVYLIDANLDSANLDSADLSSADLSSVNLDSANLRSADLRGADLSSANLRSADLRGADLRGADLSCFMELTEKPKKPICTDLKGVKNLTFQQIKAAEHWEQACYDPELRKQLNLPPENPKNCAGEGEDK